MMPEEVLKSLGLVFSGAISISSLVVLGYFDSSYVETGYGHYAEIPYWLGKSVPMPLNTAINFGFITVGLYWINKVYKAQFAVPLEMNFATKNFFYLFNWMAILYGPTQLMRIVTQKHFWAVLDQWFTLPFFALVLAWHQNFINYKTGVGVVKPFHVALIELISCISYCLTWHSDIGFEIALAIHITLAMIQGVRTYKYCKSSSKAYNAFWLAILANCGFVVLKLADHHLPNIHPVFYYLSGHFLSKICDCMQIYYVNNYHFNLLKQIQHPD